ncbi:MAG TPA: ELWxxDGT repeat protein, partial [Thermoanaerobaculia bacterium]|nr:ELWxxDGT repeat protein [Thermoanaerobaculia bacterium]
LDIRPGGSSAPGSFVVWNGAAWFAADDGVHGRELWTTDGTPGGTQLVADFRPGPLGGLGSDQGFITRFFTAAPLGGLLLFAADDGVHGWELWATDGTGPGTALMADIEPGAGSSNPTWLTPFGGEVLFQAEQTGLGRSLWKTDGTAAGTALVRSFDPPFGSSLFPFVESGGKLFFAASTSAEGYELWVTDGSTAGTMRVEDIQPGPGGALAWNFAFGIHSLGDRVVLQADDGLHGGEPWVSDGTPGGTQMLADLNPGPEWAFGQFTAPLLAGNLDGRAYFFAFDPEAGWELRSTGGEPGDVTLVKDLDDQASAIVGTPFFRRTELADADCTLFYLAADPDHGAELWASDGTESGTRLVRDLEPGPPWGFPTWLTALGAQLLFEGPGDGNHRWLWVSDGTEGGTVPITGAVAHPLNPSPLTRFGGRVYFGADAEGGGRTLWVTDGTEAGTHPFPEGGPLPAPWGWDLAVAGDRLFVGAVSELWVTAGDAASSEKLADVEARDLAPAGPLVFFSGDDGATGPELWVSDGTPGGTRRVLDLVPGPEGALEPRPGSILPLPDGPAVAGTSSSPPAAFFVADDGVHGPELWWSDGTEAGTRLLGNLRPGPLGS